METKSQEIIQTIEKMVFYIRNSNGCDSEYYNDFFIYILSELNKPHELNKIAENILKIYGGMGTFGDFGLYKDGNLIDINEDQKFDQLREKLYTQCQEGWA